MLTTSFAPEAEECERAEAFDAATSEPAEEPTSLEETSSVSAARLRANRENALKSTGPKTAEGKKRSRANALKHGLTGSGVVLAEEEERTLPEEVEKWSAELNPENEVDRVLVETLVLSVRKLRRAETMDISMRVEQARRAESAWELDRRAAAAKIASKLHKAPSETVAALEDTPQGCDWLLGCWRDLRTALLVKGEWSEEQHRLALDLLGVHPANRDSSTDLPGDATLEDKQALVDDRIEWLEWLRDESLREIDEELRDDTIQGRVFDDSDRAERLRRYHAANLRLFFRVLNHFQGRIRPPRARQESARTPLSSSPAQTAPRATFQPAEVRPAPVSRPTPPRVEPAIEPAVKPAFAVEPARPAVSMPSINASAAPNPTGRRERRARRRRR